MAKLTIKDIVAQKDKLKSTELKRKDLYIPSLDAEITIIQPTRAQILEIKDMNPDEANDYLVYQCVVDPNLKESHSELMKEFGCAEPHEVVQYLFKMQETSEVAGEILKLAGISENGAGVKAVEDLKN